MCLLKLRLMILIQMLDAEALDDSDAETEADALADADAETERRY